MKMAFEYETEIIEFTVKYSERKTLEIRIEPPDTVTVRAPKKASKDDVLKIVKSKAKWIVQKLFELSQVEYRKTQKEFVNGESFMYLGRNYLLELIYDNTVNNPITKLYQGKFYLNTNTNDKEKLRNSMEEWYREKALEKVVERVDYFQSYFSVTPRAIKVKEQKRRWASCTSTKDLLFNWRCVMAPLYVLDYIVVHEMCHMIHLNHSSNYWNLVESIMPDYKKRKEWLKKHGLSLHL